MPDGNEMGGVAQSIAALMGIRRPQATNQVAQVDSAHPPKKGQQQDSLFEPRTSSRQSHNTRSPPVKETGLFVVRTDISDARLYLGPAQ